MFGIRKLVEADSAYDRYLGDITVKRVSSISEPVSEGNSWRDDALKESLVVPVNLEGRTIKLDVTGSNRWSSCYGYFTVKSNCKFRCSIINGGYGYFYKNNSSTIDIDTFDASRGVRVYTVIKGDVQIKVESLEVEGRSRNYTFTLHADPISEPIYDKDGTNSSFNIVLDSYEYNKRVLKSKLIPDSTWEGSSDISISNLTPIIVQGSDDPVQGIEFTISRKDVKGFPDQEEAKELKIENGPVYKIYKRVLEPLVMVEVDNIVPYGAIELEQGGEDESGNTTITVISRYENYDYGFSSDEIISTQEDEDWDEEKKLWRFRIQARINSEDSNYGDFSAQSSINGSFYIPGIPGIDNIISPAYIRYGIERKIVPSDEDSYFSGQSLGEIPWDGGVMKFVIGGTIHEIPNLTITPEGSCSGGVYNDGKLEISILPLEKGTSPLELSQSRSLYSGRDITVVDNNLWSNRNTLRIHQDGVEKAIFFWKDEKENKFLYFGDNSTLRNIDIPGDSTSVEVMVGEYLTNILPDQDQNLGIYDLRYSMDPDVSIKIRPCSYQADGGKIDKNLIISFPANTEIGESKVRNLEISDTSGNILPLRITQSAARGYLNCDPWISFKSEGKLLDGRFMVDTNISDSNLSIIAYTDSGDTIEIKYRERGDGYYILEIPQNISENVKLGWLEFRNNDYLLRRVRLIQGHTTLYLSYGGSKIVAGQGTILGPISGLPRADRIQIEYIVEEEEPDGAGSWRKITTPFDIDTESSTFSYKIKDTVAEWNTRFTNLQGEINTNDDTLVISYEVRSVYYSGEITLYATPTIEMDNGVKIINTIQIKKEKGV